MSRILHKRFKSTDSALVDDAKLNNIGASRYGRYSNTFYLAISCSGIKYTGKYLQRIKGIRLIDPSNSHDEC